MKKAGVLLALLICFSLSKAQTEFIRSQDWEAIKKQAKTENKLIFIDAYTDWCGWCKVMDQKTFSDPAICNMMKHYFVNVKLEMEQEELGKKLAAKYAISAFPTYLVFNPNGELVYTLVGFMEPADFTHSLMDILNPSNQRVNPGFDTSLNHTYPDFYHHAMVPKKGKKKFPKPEEVNAWLDKNPDLTHEVNWVVFNRFASYASESHSSSFWKSYALLDSLYGNDMVKDAGRTLLGAEVDRLIEANDLKTFEKVVNSRLAVMEEPEETAELYRIYFFKKTKNWSELNRALTEKFKKEGAENTAAWDEECWDIYENCPDSALVRSALVWIDAVCAIEPDYNYLDTYAALLYKAGDYEAAEKKALEAIDKGRKANKDVEATETLLKKIQEETGAKH